MSKAIPRVGSEIWTFKSENSVGTSPRLGSEIQISRNYAHRSRIPDSEIHSDSCRDLDKCVISREILHDTAENVTMQVFESDTVISTQSSEIGGLNSNLQSDIKPVKSER